MPSQRQSVLGVNLAWLVPGVVGGSEEYTIRLLQSVEPHLSPDLRLRLFARADLIRAYPDLAERYETIVAPNARTKVHRIAIENSWLAARTRPLDAVHHAGGTVPYIRTAGAMVTIHDLQPLEFPENFHPAKRRWLQRAIPAAVAAADLVTCPSQFTATRLNELLGVPTEKLRVVPHGHTPHTAVTRADMTRTGASGADPDRAAAFGRYLLYPAIAYPHKRHVDLVRALGELGGAFDDVSVVFTGREGPEMAATLAEADRLGLAKRVHSLGRIPLAELEALYRSAAAMVFPSGYEGFGNPALEAMNFGCPAVVSDGGALPEVIGDAGLMFPVGDVEAIAAAVSKVLTDPLLADDLRRRGVDRAGRFAVGIAAGRLAEVYRELVEVRRRAR